MESFAARLSERQEEDEPRNSLRPTANVPAIFIVVPTVLPLRSIAAGGGLRFQQFGEVELPVVRVARDVLGIRVGDPEIEGVGGKEHAVDVGAHTDGASHEFAGAIGGKFSET